MSLQLSSVGSAVANAGVDVNDHVRVTSTVGGVGNPSVSYRVVAVGVGT